MGRHMQREGAFQIPELGLGRELGGGGRQLQDDAAHPGVHWRSQGTRSPWEPSTPRWEIA